MTTTDKNFLGCTESPNLRDLSTWKADLKKRKSMASILTVEDNVETQVLLKKALEERHKVHFCYDLTSAREFLKTNQVDLIILDLVLPDGSGMDFFQDLSTTGGTAPKIPIIILSSLTDMQMRVSGLQSGADDYITKPFDKQELLARIDSVLRRGPTRHRESTITVADVTIDLTKQSAFFNDQGKSLDLSLTPIELKILMTLANQFGLEISREDVKKAVWSSAFVSKRNVDTHICKLRKKLEPTRIDINNKRGKGYYLTTKSTEVDVPATEQLPAFTKSKEQVLTARTDL